LLDILSCLESEDRAIYALYLDFDRFHSQLTPIEIG
jgi:hypothetical protein